MDAEQIRREMNATRASIDRKLDVLTIKAHAVRTLAGQPLGSGELLQFVQAGTVTNRLVFHFSDSSL